MMVTHMRSLLMMLFVCALGFPTAVAQQKIVKDGVDVEFTIEPV